LPRRTADFCRAKTSHKHWLVEQGALARVWHEALSKAKFMDEKKK
jgi:hypothetical protein